MNKASPSFDETFPRTIVFNRTLYMLSIGGLGDEERQ